MLELQPLNFAEAVEFIKHHHRHHNPPIGHKFSIGVNNGIDVVGVIIVGRPVSRRCDDGWTAEVTRCCTDGTPNACSKLYAAAWRTSRAMGYRKLITYTLTTEPGISLKAAGWCIVGSTDGKSWSVPTRPRVDTHPLQRRFKWECSNGQSGN